MWLIITSMKNKSFFFPFHSFIFMHRNFFACKWSGGNLEDASLSSSKEVGREGAVKQFVFCWLKALHHRWVSYFRRGMSGRSRALLCFAPLAAGDRCSYSRDASFQGSGSGTAGLCHPRLPPYVTRQPVAMSTNEKACRQNSNSSVGFFFFTRSE